MSRCHSHQLTCQFREMAIGQQRLRQQDPAPRRRPARRARAGRCTGARSGRRRSRRAPRPGSRARGADPRAASGVIGSSSGGSVASESTAQTPRTAPDEANRSRRSRGRSRRLRRRRAEARTRRRRSRRRAGRSREAIWKPAFLPVRSTPGVARACRARNPERRGRRARRGGRARRRAGPAASPMRKPSRKLRTRRGEDEPEVRRLVLPGDVEVGDAQEQEEAGERDGAAGGAVPASASHSAARSSRSCSGPRKSFEVVRRQEQLAHVRRCGRDVDRRVDVAGRVHLDRDRDGRRSPGSSR